MAAELVAPSRCVACDEYVGSRVVFCGACAPSVLRAGRQPEAQYAVFAYGGAVSTAVTRFKYGGRFDLGSRLGPLMAEEIADRGPAVDLVVPVPLHPSRLAERGYDQAAILAAPVARRLDVPFAPRGLVRTRATPPQASLDRAARLENIASAFRCRVPRAIREKRVLVVDDVRTTGGTLAACAKVLTAAGASHVCTLVFASRDSDDGES